MNLFELYDWFDKFAHDTFRRRHSRLYSTKQLNDAKCIYPDWKPLTKAQKKEIADFWGLKKPERSDFYTHEIMFNVKGDFDVRYVPEKVFRLYLDPALGDRKLLWAWDDKNYFEIHQPKVPFPHTYVRNINGYFLDHDYEPINKEEAQKIIIDHLPLLVKPALFSGEGKGIRILSSPQEVEDCLANYPKNYLLQEVISQCDELKQIGQRCVNTIRLVTAIVDGRPRVLTSHILCNTTDSVAVNANAAPGVGVVIIGIDEEGRLVDTGYYENAKSLRTLPSGFTFGGLKIPAYHEAVNIALEAHKSMPMLGFIGWDIAIDDHNKPVFVEWNLRGIEIYHSQLSMDPLFGPYTEHFAAIARKLIQQKQFTV